MPYHTLLARTRKLIRTRVPSHWKGIQEGSFRSGWLKLPPQPMTDHELARAIRELADLRLDAASFGSRSEGP
jgi:hypothetical protein